MNPVFIVAVAVGLGLGPGITLAQPAQDCPVSRPLGKPLDAPFPKSDSWLGNAALAIQLPAFGVWPTTRDGHLVAVKLFWWSTGFEPGMESDLKVTVRSVTGNRNSVVINPPGNAYAPTLKAWTMLTGIDFPDPGCWEFTAAYHDQELKFVVQTVDSTEYRQFITEHSQR